MKQARRNVADDDLRTEYDFSKAVRGKYYDRYRSSSNIVVLDPDVSAAFPNAALVNDALRMLATVARRRVANRGSALRRVGSDRHRRRATVTQAKRRRPGLRDSKRPIWELIVLGAQELTAKGITPFTRGDLIACVQRARPGCKPGSINPIIQGLTDNLRGGAPGAAGKDLLHSVARNRFVLRR